MLQLISLCCLNRPRRSRTVVYLLQFVGIEYLDRSITSSLIRFQLQPKLVIKLGRQVRLRPYSHFSVTATTDKNGFGRPLLLNISGYVVYRI